MECPTNESVRDMQRTTPTCNTAAQSILPTRDDNDDDNISDLIDDKQDDDDDDLFDLA